MDGKMCRVYFLLVAFAVFGIEECFSETTTLSNDEEILKSIRSNIQFPKNRKSSGVSKRIIGGNVANAHEYPYQVALYVYVQITLYFCGGSLISERWVLTAAHCVDVASYTLVLLGSHDLSVAEPNRVVLNTSTFIVHEKWDESIFQNDIALIRLPRKVTFNQYISPIALANGTDLYTGLIGRVLGWGVTILGFLSSVLKYVDATVISNENCSSYENYKPFIVSQHICTSGQGIVGSCNGDSGGPLVVDGKQIGIVSFGYTDCAASQPSVYSRVTHFTEWIQENIEIENVTETTDDGEGNGTRMGLNLGVLLLPVFGFICGHL